MVFVLPCSISIILQSHTGRGSQCRQDRTRDRCNQLHNKLSCLFFIHIFLLSLLILGTVPKTEPAPQVSNYPTAGRFLMGQGRYHCHRLNYHCCHRILNPKKHFPGRPSWLLRSALRSCRSSRVLLLCSVPLGCIHR